jgi:diguanylate cyclase (GGDEF)-like protein
MSNASTPVDIREAERLEKLKSFGILDTSPEREFDAIVLLTQRLFDVPIALVSLVDDHRQWFKAKCGIAVSEASRGDAFCTHAMLVEDLMIVEDARLDPRFADNPYVAKEGGVRFYAGVPLRPKASGFSPDLPGIGTLCIVDTKPRTLTNDDAHMLRELAALVTALIQARATAAVFQDNARELKKRANTLESQHLQLKQAERMAGVGSWGYDLDDQLLSWSDQVYVIYGLPPGEMPSVEEGLRFYPKDRRGEIARLLDRATRHGESFDFESDFFTADGRKRRVRSMGEVQMKDGRPAALIGLFQDVTDGHRREQSLRQTANTDALTGLANRACFEKELAGALQRAKCANAPACLFLLDLDGFKGVNDTFGHAAGDEVLRMMADRLTRLAPPKSIVARLGGDEFVMLLTRPRDCAKAEQIIVEILEALRHGVERDGQFRAVSTTVGAAFLDASITLPAELTQRADLALYEAKRCQRGTGRIFGHADPIQPSRALKLMAG